MKYTFSIELLELKLDKDGHPYGGDPIVSITRTTKKSAIAFIKKGVQRPDVLSGWVTGYNSNYDETFRCYIYKNDDDITDQTGW
jgi:hypothetical protein